MPVETLSESTSMTQTTVRKGQQARDWMCGNTRVYISPSAEIADGFRPGQENGGLVEELLLGVAPWRGDKGAVETLYGIEPGLEVMVIPNLGRRPVWAIHADHTARHPQLSPFMHTNGDLILTDSLTVELADRATQPRLVRVYPGEPVPPLPWQVSAADFDAGGMNACVKFWQTHSYVYSRASIVKGTQTSAIPNWYS